MTSTAQRGLAAYSLRNGGNYRRSTAEKKLAINWSLAAQVQRPRYPSNPKQRRLRASRVSIVASITEAPDWRFSRYQPRHVSRFGRAVVQVWWRMIPRRLRRIRERRATASTIENDSHIQHSLTRPNTVGFQSCERLSCVLFADGQDSRRQLSIVRKAAA